MIVITIIIITIIIIIIIINILLLLKEANHAGEIQHQTFSRSYTSWAGSILESRAAISERKVS